MARPDRKEPNTPETGTQTESQPSQPRADRHPRFSHRARAHDSAHADADLEAQPADMPEHPLIPRNQASLVSTDAGLRELIEHLRSAGSFAYDSEFIGELTYVPKLCLIQIASPQQVVLVDPLAGIDLRPFWELLCDPSVEKIVHAGEQDVEPVIRHLGKRPSNIFDTQIAAGFAAMAYPVSLSKLVYELVGVRLGKGLTFTHWDQRPLSKQQLRYAADDVRYLPALRAKIGRRLEEWGHAARAKEESEAMGDPAMFGFDRDSDYLRIRGAGGLTPAGLAVLRELAAWRNSAARDADVPPRSFLRDEILLDMARSPNRTVDQLKRVKGLPRPVEAEHGRTIVEATARALALPVGEMPVPKVTEESPVQKFRADSLWAAAQCLAAGRGIDPALVSSRQELGEFYRTAVRGGDVSGMKLMKGWRREIVGEGLVDLLGGSGRAEFAWAEGVLRTTTRNS